MQSRPALVWTVVAGALVAGAALADSLALLPVRRGVRQLAVTELVRDEVERVVAARIDRIAPAAVRDEMRSRRLRAADAALADELAELAARLGADWLLAVELHDAPEAHLPDLTLSARLYDGASGRLAWAGAVGRSALTGRRLLGLGVAETFDELVPLAVADLLEPVLPGGSRVVVPAAERSSFAERVAIVPFTALADEEGLEVATAATETLRATLFAAGVELAEPGCVRRALRRAETVRWGELDAAARAALGELCGAAELVTGAVERWEMGGSGRAPEPTVAVALRRLAVTSGEILWTGSLEAAGWDRESWFGRGRIHSRGTHLRRLLERIAREMLAADPAVKVMKEAS